MQKKSLKEYMDKQSPSAWVWAVEQAINEMMVEIRNLKQQVDKLMKWKEFEDRERRNHLLNAKDIDRKWQCGKCDQQKAKEEGKLFRKFVEFPEHFRTCEKRGVQKIVLCEGLGCQEKAVYGVGANSLPAYCLGHWRTKIEQMKEEKERWRPKMAENYFYVNSEGFTSFDSWSAHSGNNTQRDRFDHGNMFKDQISASKAASEIRKLLKSLQQ